MFAFVDYRQTKEEFLLSGEDEYYFEPDLPKNTDYVEFSSFIELNFGLFEIDLQETEIRHYSSIQKVSQTLELLLYSAKKYQPALALLRKLIRYKQIKGKKEFEKSAVEILKQHLSEQSNNPFFLVKAIDSDTIERKIGEYYWIVGCKFDENQLNVEWINWDFYIYEAPIEHFAVTPKKIKQKFG